MRSNDYVRAALTTAMHQQGETLRSLGKKIGRSHNWVGIKLRGESVLDLDEAEQLCGALHLDLARLVKEAKSA